ncbi:antiviral reverse transcriptase Drt3b [Pantoea agglomerans]|uniref:antiviral reverse transcriptase Drt3b n=1 Tax=Enterobacter agglomerans TaxID=549 RepID=UPI002D779EC0|nr:antiviral reverse transcriptase Drt3b [Pantoea agglomerans]WRO88787.1 antiviral reverse transcriptase Drt3b [Pantoea agglomerans]
MKIKIKKGDYNRVLLTDVLPYEVPILFSNEDFYHIISRDDLPCEFKELFSFENFKTTVPYTYKIKKGQASFRSLAIIHPAHQLKICHFYKQYEHLIIHLCSISDISLRYPNKIGTYYYEKDFLKDRVRLKDGGVDLVVDGFDLQSQTASSYFSYKKYPFLYKFYESFEFHRLERKYEYMVKFDISKCFSHIYTHSLAWAVKNKKYAKENTDSTHFEGALDKLFRDFNHGETNGILIGPEVSRIYAEIILQRIDLNIIEKLSKFFNLNFNDDYVIKRYVDDYFIFVSDEMHLSKIEMVLSSELEHYKLYLNESKKETTARPFITGLTIAKYELKQVIDDVYSDIVDVESMYEINSLIFRKNMGDDLGKIDSVFLLDKRKKKFSRAGEIIKSIKVVIKRNQITFDQVSSYLLMALKKKLFSLLKILSIYSYDEKRYLKLMRFVSVQLEVIFFVYSMDNRVRPTYVACQIILEVNAFAERFDDDIKEVLKKNLLDEVALSLKNVISYSGGGYVEFSNILIALKELGGEYYFDQSYLIDFIDSKMNDSEGLSYFVICSILYYIHGRNDCTALIKRVENIILDKFKDNANNKNDCEMTLLISDVLSCPVLDDKYKIKAYRAFYPSGKKAKPTVEIQRTINFFRGKVVFFNWLGNKNLEQILYRKELRTPYE